MLSGCPIYSPAHIFKPVSGCFELSASGLFTRAAMEPFGPNRLLSRSGPGVSPEGPERSGGRRCRRAPGVRRLVGGCRVEAGRKRTNFHRKLTPLPPGPPSPIASGQVARSEKCGPVALVILCLQEQVPGDQSICIGFVCQPSPPCFHPSFRPTETPIPGASADAQVGPRLPFGERASPTHHTGRRAALTPTCGLFPEPALLVPLNAPSCPVAAHRPPDATHLRVGQQGYRELSIELRAQVSRPSSDPRVASLQSAANRWQLRPGADIRSAARAGRRQWAGRARASSARS